MDRASTDGSITIITHDLDFGTLLAMPRSAMPSVVQIRTQDVLPAIVGDRELTALHATRLWNHASRRSRKGMATYLGSHVSYRSFRSCIGAGCS
jgi:hypothetical protein